MKLAITLWLFLVGIHASQGTVTDAEVEAAFDELEKMLTNNQNIIDKINGAKADIIKETTKGPAKKARLLGMAKALNLAVPKLKSSDSAEVAQGVLNVVAGIAEFVPGGVFVASFMSIISSIIGLVSGTKADNTIRDIVSAAVRESADEEMEGKAAASRAELTAAMQYLLSKHDKELDADDVTRMTTQIRVTTGIGILEMLANRIKHRSKSTNKAEQQQCYNFCLLYAQIASIRDMIMIDLIYQLRRAGDNDEADGYENVKLNNINAYRRTLQFLNDPEPAQAGVVHLYHPPGHSTTAKYIHDFMKMAKVAPATAYLSASYNLRSVKWPQWRVYAGSYMEFSKNVAPFRTWMDFTKRDDGYWRISKAKYRMVVTEKYPKYVTVKESVPDNNERSHFVVMRYAGSQIVTISCRKWPEKFWKGESGTEYLVLRDGFTGDDTQLTMAPSPRVDTDYNIIEG
uniref:TX-1 n=1 Tax=Chrysaora fuscescens TaxID=880219 RepID=A0A165TKZ8_9CNID|nr:TX-1 precursor [Chrysaora fuscescens]